MPEEQLNMEDNDFIRSFEAVQVLNTMRQGLGQTLYDTELNKAYRGIKQREDSAIS